MAPSCPGGVCAVVVATVERPRLLGRVLGNALDLVNGRRSREGVRLYVEDPKLAAAAKACVEYRAKHGIVTHRNYDDLAWFPAELKTYGPPDRNGMRHGLFASGTEGYDSGPEFATCAMTDRSYTHAGAASCQDANGRWYHQLFVR